MKSNQNPKAQATLKALLAASGHEEKLLHYLPADLAEEIRSLSLAYPFSADVLLSPLKWSESIHYTWFFDVLRGYPPNVKSLFLGTLSPEQAEGIRQMPTFEGIESFSSAFLRPFLMHVLRATMQEPDCLSRQQLPPTPLNLLLQLERKYLLRVMDFLGLYDLAADLRQVVDKNLLGKIHQALNEQQLHFLQYCSKQPIKWVSPKLGLNTWDGTKKQLNHLLHYRGLIRLAKAVSHENASFKWHLTRHLDMGRAKIIQKEFYQKQNLALLAYFKNQVLHIAKRYQK